MKYLFNAVLAFYGNLPSWDVGSVKENKSLFVLVSSFNSVVSS